MNAIITSFCDLSVVISVTSIITLVTTIFTFSVYIPTPVIPTTLISSFFSSLLASSLPSWLFFKALLLYVRVLTRLTT
jgi:hypothetical protein